MHVFLIRLRLDPGPISKRFRHCWFPAEFYLSYINRGIWFHNEIYKKKTSANYISILWLLVFTWCGTSLFSQVGLTKTCLQDIFQIKVIKALYSSKLFHSTWIWIGRESKLLPMPFVSQKNYKGSFFFFYFIRWYGSFNLLI